MTARSRRSWVPWAVLFFAAIVPWLPALWDGFAFDDGGIILENPAVWSHGPQLAWSSPFWPGRPQTGLYRPWTTFTFWRDARIFGRAAWGFHAVNLLLNLGCSLLLWRVLLALFPSRRKTALACALLFALHPLHSEPVVAVIGRAELLAAFWGLAAYLLALRWAAARARRWEPAASAAAFAIALLSKESAAGLLLLPVAHLALLRWTSHAPRQQPKGAPEGAGNAAREGAVWKRVLALWGAPLALVLLLRIRVLGSPFALEQVSLSDNVLAHVSAFHRILTALGIQGFLALRLFLPLPLSADYSYPQIVPSAGWMAAGAAVLVLAASGALIAFRRKDRPMLWGIALLCAAGALTSNLVFPIGTVLGERLAYLPSAGALWIAAEGASRAFSRTGSGTRRLLLAVVLAWGCVLGVRSGLRARDWQSDLSLFGATVEAAPRSAKARTNHAASLLRAGRTDEALAESEAALRLYPEYPAARETRGGVLAKAGRFEEALAILRPLAAAEPARPGTCLELGNIYLETGRTAQAESCFARAAQLMPAPDRKLLIGRASVLALQSRWPEARLAWQNAVAASPREPDVLRNWAYALWKAGAADSAEAVYGRALALAPSDPDSWNDLAWFLAQSGRNPARAVGFARRAFAARPGETTGDTLLEALLAEGGCAAARAWADSLRARSGLPQGVERTLEEHCSGSR